MSILKYSIGCIVLSTMLLACSKDEKYDIRGNKETRFFLNNMGFGNRPGNSISYNVLNRPDGNTGAVINMSTTLPEVIKFPVFATHKVTDEVVISAELDNSLIAQYNAGNNTSYEAFPDGFLNTANLSARIARDMDYSVDSITIPVASVANVTALTGAAYMAPIRLTSVSKQDIGSITSVETSTVTYIVIHPEMRMIEYNVPGDMMPGTRIMDRSGWSASFDPVRDSTGSILDGVNSTYSRWPAATGNTGTVTVGMDEVKDIRGIRIYTASSATYSATAISVYTSVDGVNYELQGSPLRANLTTSQGYTHIAFYKSIPAKFVRLAITYSTSTNQNNRRLAEFDVYEN